MVVVIVKVSGGVSRRWADRALGDVVILVGQTEAGGVTEKNNRRLRLAELPSRQI